MSALIEIIGDPMFDLYEYGYLEDNKFIRVEDINYLHSISVHNILERHKELDFSIFFHH